MALPFEKYGVQVYESGLTYVVDIPELKTNVSYNGVSFSIRMPYHLFGNNTQGQCGKDYFVCPSKMKYCKVNQQRKVLAV